MEPLEIGDITLEPQGDRLRLTIAEGQDSTTWTMIGASFAGGYLVRWLEAQTGGDLVSSILEKQGMTAALHGPLVQPLPDGETTVDAEGPLRPRPPDLVIHLQPPAPQE